jgi:hypothetical protein
MKTFKFIYEDTEYEGPGDKWPVQSLITAEHMFEDDTTWPNVLRQFTKFLESTGYDQVTERIRVEDKYGINEDCGFETYDDDEEDGIIGIAEIGSDEWNKAMGDLNKYLGSLSEAQKQDIDRVLDKQDKDAQ